MKKIAAILLLSCLFFTVLGYHFIFQFQLQQAKAEMQINLRNLKGNKELSVLCFNQEQLKQIDWENNHEFNYNGKMYDVIEKHFKNGKLLVRCIADNKETVLIKEYLASQKNSSGNQPLSSLLKLVTNNFIRSKVAVLSVPEKNNCNNFPFYSSTIFSIIHPIHTPPPRVCFVGTVS